MLGNLPVRLNASNHITARVQIENEIMENYAEMTGSHPATNKRASKNGSDHLRPLNPRVLKTSPSFLLPHKFEKENQKINFASPIFA
jgi:hypothetical protein